MALKGLSKHIDVALHSTCESPPPNSGKKGFELEFMPAYLEVLERPPSRVGRLFGFSIMALCSFALIWSILGKIDVIASAPGRVIVSHRSKIVQAPTEGEITRIAVWDGIPVSEGDVLIELNPTLAQADLLRLHNLLSLSELRVARLEALLTEDPLISFKPPISIEADRIANARAHLAGDIAEQAARERTYASQLRQIDSQKSAAQAMIDDSSDLYEVVRERYDSLETLSAGGDYPRLQLLQLRQEFIEYGRALTEHQSNLVVLQAQAVTIASEAAEQKAAWRRSVLDRLDEERNRLVELRQQQTKAQESLRMNTIVASVDGVVQQLSVSTIGGVVTQGQELMVIVPDDAELEVEISILNKDVGFVRSGQSVEIKIDSFPYTRYGTIPGEVLHVSRESTEDEQLGLVFLARVKLEHSSMHADGEVVPLSPGMRTTAEIRTGDRRVIDYLLSPLQEYGSEAMRER